MSAKRRASVIRPQPLPELRPAPPAPVAQTGLADGQRTLVRFVTVALALFLFRWIIVPDAKAPSPGADPAAPVEVPQGIQALGYEFDGIPALRGSAGWGGVPKLNESIMGGPMTLGGKPYASGIGTHAPSEIFFSLRGTVRRFSCLAGVDGRGNEATSLHLVVKGDGRNLYRSPLLGVKSPPLRIDLDVTGVREMVLEVDPAGDRNWDQVDWVNLKFEKAVPADP